MIAVRRGKGSVGLALPHSAKGKAKAAPKAKSKLAAALGVDPRELLADDA